MKLSTKSRYGLRAVYCLAQNYGNQPVSLSKISADTAITKPYLEKLLNLLKKQGIIQSTRGLSGGYYLAKSPKETNVGEVLRALEDNLVIADCNTTCKSKCPNRFVFNKLYTEINKTLNSISIEDMLKNEEE